MDNFQVTFVNDGTMVSTRRGLQVSKQKHNGTAFVNSSAHDIANKTAKARSRTKPTLQVAGEITFVPNGDDGRRYTSGKTKRNGVTKRVKSASPSLRISDLDHGRGKRASSVATSLTSISNSSAEEPSEEPAETKVAERRLSSPVPLPSWASYGGLEQPTELSERLRLMRIASGVGSTDPIDDEIRFSTHKWFDNVRDPTILHCALTLGALYRAIISGLTESQRLNVLTSQLSSIINRRLSHGGENKAPNDVTIHAIATLAIITGYQSKLDHWHVHMKGLVNLVQCAGGLDKLGPRTRCIIGKADLTGAIAAATKPRIMPTCYGLGAEDPDFIDTQDDHYRTMREHFTACNTDQRVIAAIVLVAHFSKSITQHRQEWEGSTLREETAMKQYHKLASRLLSYPGPLCDLEKVTSPPMEPDFSLSSPGFSATQSVSSVDGNEGSTASTAIERATRILALLYLRAAMLELPCGDETLLDLLIQYTKVILEDLRTTASLLEPATWREMKAPQRPVLVWICLAGDVFLTLKRNSRGAVSQTTLQSSEVSRQFAIEIMGPKDSGGMQPVSDIDLQVCRQLDLRSIKGEQWDEREALSNMLQISSTE